MSLHRNYKSKLARTTEFLVIDARSDLMVQHKVHLTWELKHRVIFSIRNSSGFKSVKLEAELGVG
jgi:hypothetical protein